MADITPAPNKKKSFTVQLKFDYRFIIGVLVFIIIVMLLLWQPWVFRSSMNNRTVTEYGMASVTGVPDQFVFSPSYSFKDANKDAVLKMLSAKSDEVTKKLKEIGVAENKIKTNTDGYDFPIYGAEDGTSYGSGGPDEGDVSSGAIAPRDTRMNYTLRMTITVDNKTLAQKVQDYLVTTSPEGEVSPKIGFSNKKGGELEDKARELAMKDARKRAEQSAKTLHFSLGPIKTVDDGVGFSGVQPLTVDKGTTVKNLSEASDGKLTIYPGENELQYQVTVVYYIK